MVLEQLLLDPVDLFGGGPTCDALSQNKYTPHNSSDLLHIYRSIYLTKEFESMTKDLVIFIGITIVV